MKWLNEWTCAKPTTHLFKYNTESLLLTHSGLFDCSEREQEDEFCKVAVITAAFSL